MRKETDILEEFAEKLERRLYKHLLGDAGPLNEEVIETIVWEAVAELRGTIDKGVDKCKTGIYPDIDKIKMFLIGKEKKVVTKHACTVCDECLEKLVKDIEKGIKSKKGVRE